MYDNITRLAVKIAEGVQGSSLNPGKETVNVFQRPVLARDSTDLSFISGLVASGLRGSALIDSKKLLSNYNQFLSAYRQHIPLVVNTNAGQTESTDYANIAPYQHLHAIRQTGCFQFIACSPLEEICLTLIAHRIAELSLIPGIVIADYDRKSETAEMLPDNKIRQFLGNPDDRIECPTPGQKIIFGASRRRIPNWFSFDIPALLNPGKNGNAIANENAAHQKYFYDHLDEMIVRAFQEFETVFGFAMQPVNITGASADYAFVHFGSLIEKSLSTADSAFRNIASIRINQLAPFPKAHLSPLLSHKKAITIFEPLQPGVSDQSYVFDHLLSSGNAIQQKAYHARCNANLNVEDLKAAANHMISREQKMQYFLGIAFTKPASKYPKHEILLKEIENQYPGISDDTLSGSEREKKELAINGNNKSVFLRKYEDHGPAYSQLSRFYADTAFFYEHEIPGEIVADPFSGIPLVPPASAGFFNMKQDRDWVPVIDHTHCTGCGDCFVYCPHSALAPVSIGVEELVRTGINLASRKGTVIIKMTPVIRPLAKACSKIIRETEAKTIEDILQPAFNSVLNKMNPDPVHLKVLQTEFSAIMDEISILKVAITDAFYHTPDQSERGSGEFFSLAVNTESCTGCGVCAEVCQEDAINMLEQEHSLLTTAEQEYHLWENLPDTKGETIQRLYSDDEYNKLAAVLLSRNYSMTLTGGSETDAFDPYKTLLHIVTATTESVVQPRYLQMIKRIDDAIQTLTDNIHVKLSNALPKENLDVLSKSLKPSDGVKHTLKEVLDSMTEQEVNVLLDTEDLRRKSKLLEALKNLKWVLSKGPSGAGRTRYGLIVAASDAMEWASRYPGNHFINPTVIQWDGSAPQKALGLFFGNLRYVLDDIKLLRRAALESGDSYDPHKHNREIANLSWDDLTDEEKRFVPPILLVAGRDDLADAGWNTINELLAENYPIKICLFDHSAMHSKNAMVSQGRNFSGIISAIALKNAFVLQGGLGNIPHLFNGLMDGINKPYPSLFNLHVIEYGRQEIDRGDWSQYAALALNSRAFPALKYDPHDQTAFLSGSIDLDGNRHPDKDWVVAKVDISEEETFDYSVSWADWAYTQKDWKQEFTRCENDQSTISVTEFIGLEKDARQGKIPVISRMDPSGLKYYKVGNAVIEVMERVLTNWKTLQELSGLITEFPEKLQKKVTNTLEEKYAKEIQQLEQAFDEKFKAQETAQTEVLRRRLKEKLVAISMMTRKKQKS